MWDDAVRRFSRVAEEGLPGELRVPWEPQPQGMAAGEEAVRQSPAGRALLVPEAAGCPG